MAKREEYNPLRLTNLSPEQQACIPRVGSIIIANERAKYYQTNGLVNRAAERRGCYIVIDTSHPKLILLKEICSKTDKGFTYRTVSKLKVDFYIKHIVWTEIKEPVWSVGKGSLSWEELAIEKFAN